MQILKEQTTLEKNKNEFEKFKSVIIFNIWIKKRAIRHFSKNLKISSKIKIKNFDRDEV
jgi:hypothetical protein